MNNTDFLLPLIISNIAGMIILFCCWKYPRTGRLLMFLLFMWAGITNWYTSSNSPLVYLDYAKYTVLPLYRDFIEGWFSRHILLMVRVIAIGQLLIGISMFLKGIFFKAGAIGGMIFFVSILPLGVGAGFPFPILGIAAFYFLYRQAPVKLYPSVKKIII